MTRIIQKVLHSGKEKSEFKTNIENNYIQTYFQVFTKIYVNSDNNKEYIDDEGKSYIYAFYFDLLEDKKYKENIIKLYFENDKLIEEIIKDCFIRKDDLELWVNDQKNYIYQKLEEISHYYFKRNRALKIIRGLLSLKVKKKKNTINYYDKFYTFLINAMKNDSKNLEDEKNLIKSKRKNFSDENYLLNPNNCFHCLLKESIIYIIKNCSAEIIQNSDVDQLIENHIFQELSSPCGLLREQACELIMSFAKYPFTNEKLLENIIRNLCYLMENDPHLSVKLYATFAIGALFDKDKTKKLLKGNIKKIFEIHLKLIEETDAEELIENLQEIVNTFAEESKDYIIQLSGYLMKYFDKILIKEKEEESENIMDIYQIISKIVSTFCSFIQYFINNPSIYSNIENYIDKLLEYLLNPDNDKIEEGIDILDNILKYGKVIPDRVWKYFPKIVESVLGTGEEISEFKLFLIYLK